MPNTYIKTLTDKDGNQIAPRTHVNAVILEDGETTIQDRLDAIDSQLSEGADLSSVDESILPSLDITYDLGSPSKRWKDLYLSDASLYIGNVKISTTNNEIKFDDVNTGNPIPFGSNYTPKATATTIGAIKPGAGFNVDGNGILTISTATTSSAGSMSSSDKTKLDGIAASANNYSHPTGDGNLHVPATSTTNNGKVLTAGATAGSLSWTSLTKSSVGLDNVDNTADLNKAVASAAKLTTARTISLTGDVTGSVSFDGSANASITATITDDSHNHIIGNIDGLQIALDGKVDENAAITAGTGTKITYDAKGLVTSSTTLSASDIPSLDASKITSGTIDSARLPSYVDDVIEAANSTAFPAIGETGKIYIALDTNKTYRWSGSVYVYITSGAVDSVAGKTGVVTLVKGDVGLGSVDNTADSEKNVLSATKLTTARTINGVSFDGSADITVADSTKQPLDADLTSIAGLTGTTGLLKKTAANTWALDTNTYVTSSGVTSVTGTAPVVSSGGTTPAISISAATTSAAGSMSAADKTKLDGIAENANNYSLPTATSTVKGGIELFSDTVQSIAANSVSAIDNRTYGIQLNSNGQAVVNVPWEGSSATYIAGNGLGLSGTTFSLDTPSTLTAVTSNGVTADSHTHAVTTTTSGAASTIVATDSSGNITAADTLNLGTAADIKYNANTKSIDFIFA